MKVRKGFVSNSSSTSFTCEVCGDTQSGWDLCRRDAGFAYLECGHDVCEDHLLNDISFEELKQYITVDNKDYYFKYGE